MLSSRTSSLEFGWLGIVAVLVCSACTEAQTPGVQSGVQSLDWVAPTPDLILGVDSATQEDDFYRIMGVAQMTDGVIAVVDGGRYGVSLFDSRGNFIEFLGGRGDGPGEFQRVPTLIRAARYDSIFISHPPRVSIIRPDRTVDVLGELNAARREVDGIIRDQFVTVHFDGSYEGGGNLGKRRSFFRFFLSDSPSIVGAFLGEVEFYLFFNADGRSTAGVPLAIPASYAMSETTLFVTDGVSPEITAVRGTNQVTKILLPVRRRRVTRREFREAVSARSQRLRRNLDGAPRPEWHPVIDRLVVDGSGGVWAKLRLHSRDESQGDIWLVIDDAGITRGTVSLPSGFYLWQVADNFILGVAKDHFDVERVERYPLRRTNP